MMNNHHKHPQFEPEDKDVSKSAGIILAIMKEKYLDGMEHDFTIGIINDENGKYYEVTVEEKAFLDE